MRLTCSQKDLATALITTSKAVDSNNTLPVLNNVLLRAEGKRLHFISTNLEVAISYYIETDVKNEGEITIPSKLFTSYIHYLKDEKVDIEVHGTDIQVKTSDSTTRFKGLPSNEFPPIPSVEKEGTMTVKVGDLKRAIGQVVFSAALNTTRPILSGVYFLVEGKNLNLVATDSYRLSERKIPVSKVSGEIACIIPAKTIMELGGILEGVGLDSELTITISKNQALFSVGVVELTTRLIEGKFPNYEQIIPKESKTQLEFSTSALSLVLKRINIFAKENNNKIILKIVNGKGLITTESTQYGEGEIALEAKITGENNEIALNSQFLLEALGSLGANSVNLEIGDKIAPVIIRTKDEKDYIHIIMPLKI